MKFPLTQSLPELKMQMRLLYCLYVLSFYKGLRAKHNALYGAGQEGGGGEAEWPLNCHGSSAGVLYAIQACDRGEKSRGGRWGTEGGRNTVGSIMKPEGIELEN